MINPKQSPLTYDGPLQMPLKVLSYNVWGIFVAKHVDVRMQRISEALQEYDVVCLQEQFEERHEKILFGPTSVFKHRHRFVSSVYGSGLLIASRYPIVSTLFVPYRTHGHPERVWEGDYFANKGMALVRVAAPAGVLGPDAQEVCVVNTHLVPQYQRYSAVGGYANERHGPCRLAQTYHLATLIASVAGNAPVVVCGDMNSGRQSPEQRLLLAVCERAGTPLSVAVDDAAAHTFTTANSHVGDPTTYLNAFSMAEDLPVQLDHIYHSRDLVCRHGAITMNERTDFGAPLGLMHMSDHFAVAATFELLPGGKPAAAATLPVAQQTGDAALREAAGYLRLGAARFMRHARFMQGLAVLLLSVPFCFSLSPVATFTAGAAAAILAMLSHGHRTQDAQLFRNIASDLD